LTLSPDVYVRARLKVVVGFAIVGVFGVSETVPGRKVPLIARFVGGPEVPAWQSLQFPASPVPGAKSCDVEMYPTAPDTPPTFDSPEYAFARRWCENSATATTSPTSERQSPARPRLKFTTVTCNVEGVAASMTALFEGCDPDCYNRVRNHGSSAGPRSAVRNVGDS
jgi:hypothetical protein